MIETDKENRFPERKLLRLKNFDYSTAGAYFITICTHSRKCTLSRVVGAIHESPEIKLTDYGKIAENVIRNIPERYNITVDTYVIMPNHIHLIIGIADSDELRAIRESPLRCRSIVSKSIGYIKMNISKEINRQFGDTAIWQRGFHDHIIRDRQDYEKITKYIYENPLIWEYDRLYVEE
ncbi:MAG: transposase [Ruminococcaceae bacterium]|nr:transposase [Oscillospiraceae bacterium]